MGKKRRMALAAQAAEQESKRQKVNTPATETTNPPPTPALFGFLRAAGFSTDHTSFELDLKMANQALHFGTLGIMHNIGNTQLDVAFVSETQSRATLVLRPVSPLQVTVHKLNVLQALASRRFRKHVLHEVVAQQRSIWEHIGVFPVVSKSPESVPTGNVTIQRVQYIIDANRESFKLILEYTAGFAIRSVIKMVAEEHRHLGPDRYYAEFTAPFTNAVYELAIEDMVLSTTKRWLSVFTTPQLLDTLKTIQFSLKLYAKSVPVALATFSKWDTEAIVEFLAHVAASAQKDTQKGASLDTEKPAKVDELRVPAPDTDGEPATEESPTRTAAGASDERGGDLSGATSEEAEAGTGDVATGHSSQSDTDATGLQPSASEHVADRIADTRPTPPPDEHEEHQTTVA